MKFLTMCCCFLVIHRLRLLCSLMFLLFFVFCARVPYINNLENRQIQLENRQIQLENRQIQLENRQIQLETDKKKT